MKLSKRILVLLLTSFSVGLIGCSNVESTTDSSLEDNSTQEQIETNLDSTQSSDSEELDNYSSIEDEDNSESEETTDNQSSSYNSNDTNTGSSYSNNIGSSHENSKHIGEGVYVANGNSYYHAISNCKYLEGASTSYVTLTSDMRKFECNCWKNPIEYEPPVSSSNESSSKENSSSSGQTVYIANGNSYYHNSPSCKFLNGASAYGVDLNNVGGKHACNCVKY
ncbi:Uncharacterised protein [[Clostridium] sordellii]|uniref:Lipoprotein n=1 Tax=Paraclostridium sordellii TaxID=1505 RepID=A0A0C7R2A8_PARSO|nr:hypothetical protein [Paeniclostridium sordellii]CEQ02985.1 Uncharacterised protein [[Clostridium] sordellii] [Paeniclostridium sordellii]